MRARTVWGLAAIVAAASGISPARAVTKNWNTIASGNYTDAAKWTPAGVPAVDDTAIFDRNGNFVYSVLFPGVHILDPSIREV